jgi:protein JSN1
VDAPVNSSAAGMSENSNGGSDASNISPSKPDTAAAAFAFTSPEAKYKDSPFPIEAYGSPSSALATPNVNAHMFGGNPELLPSSGMTLGGAQQGPPGTSTMPTRALWIGSIPGTTSSATLLQIFSPFGPVESARVLMHKVCTGSVGVKRKQGS